MAEFIDSKFWAVLPYKLVHDLSNPQLLLAAVKEEWERKPRLLCDHSWPWNWTSVNNSMVPHAPLEVMQFGRTLARVLQCIRHANPQCGPVWVAKYDLKDGFYWLFLRAADCLHLGILLPIHEGEPPLIAIPMACTMGWMGSPPTFSTGSETACDVANTSIQTNSGRALPHRLEQLATEGDDLLPA